MYLHLGLKSAKFMGPKTAKPLGVSLHVTIITGTESLKYLQLELLLQGLSRARMLIHM